MNASPASLKYLRDLVRRKSAIVIEADKDYLLDSRLAPISKIENLSFDALVDRLRKDERSPLARAVVEAMTTNETSFFRDAHPFDALKTKVLPDLVRARAAKRTLKIWCAAASTGQEPYSIAMAIREAIPAAAAAWNIQILATDLNAQVLARAKAGRYKQLEVNRGLSAPLLSKYFDRVGAEWQVKPEISSMVTFQELNLLDRWPILAEQDIIFCRNVLIYFDVPTKRDLLARMHKVLEADGTLVLGGGETTLNLSESLTSVRVGSTVLYRPKTKGI